MNSRFDNPFPYSDDNKRYQTYNYYLRHKFGTKVFKIPLNIDLGCPNRDGTKGNGRVVSASVTLRTGVCPECGRVYVAGGETNTTIKYPNETNPYQQERKSQDAADLTGARIDTRK